MLLDAPAQLVREGGRLAVSYFPDEEIHVPIFALHGALDQVIYAPELPTTQIVEGAGSWACCQSCAAGVAIS